MMCGGRCPLCRRLPRQPLFKQRPALSPEGRAKLEKIVRAAYAEIAWRERQQVTPAATETKPDLGFGIPILMEFVRERMAAGSTTEEAIAWVADYAELRSEAIYALRAALTPDVSQ